MSNATPIVATMIGDPCGIGPEVVVKALASGKVPGRKLLIGDIGVVQEAIDLVRAPMSAHRVGSLGEARFREGVLDVLDPGNLRPGDVTRGQLSAACGRAVTEWMDIALGMARKGEVGAVVKAPTNLEAIQAAAAKAKEGGGKTYLFLITGTLRVVHLTDHIPFRQVLGEVKKDNILALLRLTNDSLRRWGKVPRIGVAGINPHAEGEEDQREVAPAVETARAEGIDAVGPVSPDTIFRQCVEGAYDCVLAHYHDQGHIAVKTYRFSGNCSINLGPPYVRMSVAHGTAFDIAWRGVADPLAITAAMKTAASLAAGQGFPLE